MHLKFKNWEKYNKRAKEYKNPVWFSFENDFATNRNFFDFTDQERLIFIYLLCEASQQNKQGGLDIEIEHFAYYTRQKPKDIVTAISKLEQKQILEGRDRDGIVSGSCGDRDLAVTEQDRTRQDILSSVGQEPTREGNEKADKGSELVNLWNEKASPSLARVIQLSEARRREVVKALKKHPELEFWADVITMMNRSSFLTGDGPTRQGASKPWRCSFDFILKRDNALKILEGSYS
ncbi:MAG: hypothetical protein EBX40_02095 [Gammaproteobacteria bacterium]|nr:hypothetical protein [Gammaproteobacteria bacterium]